MKSVRNPELRRKMHLDQPRASGAVVDCMWEIHRIIHQRFGPTSRELEAANVISSFISKRADRRVPPKPFLRRIAP